MFSTSRAAAGVIQEFPSRWGFPCALQCTVTSIVLQYSARAGFCCCRYKTAGHSWRVVLSRAAGMDECVQCRSMQGVCRGQPYQEAALLQDCQEAGTLCSAPRASKLLTNTCFGTVDVCVPVGVLCTHPSSSTPTNCLFPGPCLWAEGLALRAHGRPDTVLATGGWFLWVACVCLHQALGARTAAACLPPQKDHC